MRLMGLPRTNEQDGRMTTSVGWFWFPKRILKHENKENEATYGNPKVPTVSETPKDPLWLSSQNSQPERIFTSSQKWNSLKGKLSLGT